MKHKESEAIEIKIKVPDFTGTEHTVVGDNIVFVTIDNDQDCQNPCEDDGFGTIRSFNRRHVSHIDPNEAVEMMKADPDIIPLSYFEHGNCLWWAQETSTPCGVEFQWDGTRFAGIWIPDDAVRESYTGQDGKTRHEWMVTQAQSACETYTQWANGDVYGYTVKAYKARREDGDLFDQEDDYRYSKELFDDSCWGYYGIDSVKEAIAENFPTLLESLGG